jgi:hypothetical protein
MALSEVRHKSGRPPASVACRCCPGEQSRSTRSRRYPSDMADAEWGICEPLEALALARRRLRYSARALTRLEGLVDLNALTCRFRGRPAQVPLQG